VNENPYASLLVVLVPFSLLSFGGGPSIFGPLQTQAVDVQHWMSAREFIDLFAIARVAPGPGSMLSTLIGYHLAGWPGALLATVAIFAPSSLLCFFVARVWNKYRGHGWHTALEQGLAPVATGLIAAGVVAIARLSHAGVLAWAVAAGVTALMVWRPKLHPFIALFGGGVVFALAALAGVPV
jgi:chromate transporter